MVSPFAQHQMNLQMTPVQSLLQWEPLRLSSCLEPHGHSQTPLPQPSLSHCCRFLWSAELSLISESGRMQQQRNQANKGIILASGCTHSKSYRQWLFPAVGWDQCLQTRGALPNGPDVPIPWWPQWRVWEGSVKLGAIRQGRVPRGFFAPG